MKNLHADPRWKRAGRPGTAAAEGNLPGTWLVLADGSALGRALADRLDELGNKVLMFPAAAVSSVKPDAFSAVLTEALSSGSFKGIVYIGRGEIGRGEQESLTSITRALDKLDLPAPPRLWAVVQALVQALVQVPVPTPGTTQIVLELPGEDTSELAAMLLAEEVHAGEPNVAVAYRADGRFVILDETPT